MTLLVIYAHTKDTFELGFRKMLCNAAVRSVSEAQRVNRIEFAMEVEGVRIGEDFGVTVTGLTRCDDSISFLNCLELSVQVRNL
jgi:hypothetical protein